MTSHPSSERILSLTTGRILEHYNCGTMTRRTGNAEIVSEDLLAIHPDDAAKKEIVDGDLVRIFSARSEVRVKAKLSTEVKPGILYTTFHFPEQLVNLVTSSECDEDTMCPEYKVVAVDVERVAAHSRQPKPRALGVTGDFLFLLSRSTCFMMGANVRSSSHRLAA